MDKEGNFLWVDETQLGEYTNWYKNEPTPNVSITHLFDIINHNNTFKVDGEDCIHLTNSIWNYQWNDRDCGHRFRYICQI